MSNRLKSITAKVVKSKISEGWGTQRFLDEYEIMPEEFNAKLEELFTTERARNEVRRVIKQNDKRFERHSTPKKKVASHTSTLVPSTPEVAKLDTAVYVADVEPNAEEKQEDTIAGCTAKLNQIDSEILAKLEEKAEIVADCDSLTARENVLTNEIDQLRTTISQKERELESLRRSISEDKRKLSKVDKEIADHYAESERLKTLMQNMSKVDIYVYEDGEISIENAETSNAAQIPEEWEDIYEKFSHSEDIPKELDDCLDTLTRKEIKILAKLYVVFAMLRSKNIPFEVTSEIEKMGYAAGLL